MIVLVHSNQNKDGDIVFLSLCQVSEISQCQEFEDVHLRVTEKRILNTLNKDKNRPTIRLVIVCMHKDITATV